MLWLFLSLFVDVGSRRDVVALEPTVRLVAGPSAETPSEVTLDKLNEAGAYVELGSGDLYRIPKEALIPGGSPIIHKESSGASRLVQVSKSPFVTTLEARLRCAQHNIDPNF